MRAVTIEPLDPEKIKSLEKEQVDIEKKLESSGSDRWNKNRKILVQHLRHYEWNCPDWCEGDDYPENHSALNDWQWKWEFIRRLPSYRYAFLYFQNRDGALDWLRNGLGMDEYIDPRLPVDEIPEDPFKKYRGGTFLDSGQHAASGWIIGISGIKIEFRVAGSDALRAYPSVQRMTPSSLPRRQYLLESGNICLIRLIRSFVNRECFRLSRRAEIREHCRVCADARTDD